VSEARQAATVVERPSRFECGFLAAIDLSFVFV
jgi:hypothetical protein